MERLFKAYQNSLRAFVRLARTEAAFRQELVLLVLAFPAGWLLADTWPGYVLLVGSIVFLMIVEVLNTGIEAACNAITREFHADIQLAKDCGSLAVLLACILVGAVWVLAIAAKVAG